jgi:lysophospholipase L1-like esterase
VVTVARSYIQGIPGPVGISGTIQFTAAFTIPTTGGVSVTVPPTTLADGQSVGLAINDVLGVLSRAGSAYTFTRNTGGTAVAVLANSMGFAIAPLTNVGGDLVSSSTALALEILDNVGNAAVQIDRDGAVLLPSSNTARPNRLEPAGTFRAWAIEDGAGNAAIEVRGDGVTRIAAVEAAELSVGGVAISATATGAAWNETNNFWQGYAPVSAVTSSYDQVLAGSATTAETDDFAMRQNYWCQRSGNSLKVYFDHTSDHIATYQPGASFWSSAPNMQIAFSIGDATSAVAGTVTTNIRGTINGQRRATVAAQYFGWSDPIRYNVIRDRYLALTTTQNIIGTYRLSSAINATSTTAAGAKKGGFLTTPANRWGVNVSAPSLTLDTATPDLDGCAGVRFIAIKTPVDRMVAIASDSIARGIIYTSNPAPTCWPMLLDVSLRSINTRAAVWNQGSGGGRAYTMINNSRWLDRIVNCTHLVITLGSNDLFDSRTAAQLQADITTIANAGRQAGALVFLGTVIPRTPFNASQNTERGTFNTWVRTNPYDGFFDFDNVMKTGGSPNTLLAAYDGGDGIHPNDAGHAAMLATINPLVFL